MGRAMATHILAFNAGSATLKFAAFDVVSTVSVTDSVIEHPAVDAAAFDEVGRRLRAAGVTAITAVGHRVAHGGPRLSEAALIDASVERAIELATPLAPQHNPAALAGIRLARQRWPGLPQVAVFDTAFHASMPERAATYAKDISAVAQHLRTGLAVVLTVPYRLPTDQEQRAALAREVVSGVVAGTGASLSGGIDLRVANFDPEHVSVAMAGDRQAFRDAIDAATGTTNREAALYGTPGGGMLAFVMQSAVKDDTLDQVFATLSDSASRQFTGQRGSLFWVALQGLDAEQLMSVHEQDSDPGQQPTGLRKGVSDFLTNAPDHVVGVVFGSRSGLYPTEDGSTDMGGVTNFFVKETSPYWHESFRAPLRGSGGIAQP